MALPRTHTRSPRRPRRRAALVGAAVVASLALGATACSSTDGGADSSTSATAVPTAVDADAAITAIDNGAVVLDVRTPEEFATGHLDGALNIDFSAPDFAQRVQDLDPTASYVVYCASGNRAGQAIALMGDAGFTDLVNGGGFDDLAGRGAPTATGAAD